MNEIDLEKIFHEKNPQGGKLPDWARDFTKDVCKGLLEMVVKNVKMDYHFCESCTGLRKQYYIVDDSIRKNINNIK